MSKKEMARVRGYRVLAASGLTNIESSSFYNYPTKCQQSAEVNLQDVPQISLTTSVTLSKSLRFIEGGYIGLFVYSALTLVMWSRRRRSRWRLRRSFCPFWTCVCLTRLSPLSFPAKFRALSPSPFRFWEWHQCYCLLFQYNQGI